MSTVLCPRLVALDPSVCTVSSCRSSHTHEPAFCDPCKAVHAAVHAGIHLASNGHRLRVDGPIAPVRCVVCAPLPGPAPAQFLFVGPEHYVAHARTSAHRAKLSQLPPAIRSKTKPDFGLGLGRPGENAPPFGYTRSSSTGNPYVSSPPGSRNVTPTPGPGSRPGSSMSYNAGSGYNEAPPGPSPVALEPIEYVICALCHTVLPVPLSDVWPVAGPKPRNVSGGSDATVRANGDDDDIKSTVTTTENDTEVRKSLVLANHMSTDNEHARRVKFPKFRAAYEKRIAKERRDAGLDDEVEEERPPVVDFASRLTADRTALTRSPDQVSLSSLSSSPSVDDAPPPRTSGGGGGLFFHQHYRHRRARSQDSQGPEPEPKPHRYQHDDEFVMQRQRSRSKYETSSNGSSEQRVPIRVKTQPQPNKPHGGVQPPAYVREHNLPITIPDHLLPFLSPITPSTAAPPDPQEELERYGREPTSEYLQSLPIRALSTPIRTTFMLQPEDSPPPPAQPQQLMSIPEQPTPAESTVPSSPSTSIMSRPYEPSPSPPPRLAFDDHGRVLKLGSLGWERETGPMYDDLPTLPPLGVSSTSSPLEPTPVRAIAPAPLPAPIRAPAPAPAPVRAPARPPSAPRPLPVPTDSDSDSDDAPDRDASDSEPDQPSPKQEKSVVSGSVGTVQVKRYTLNRPEEREPVREGLASRSFSGSTGRGGKASVPGRSSTLGGRAGGSVDFTPGRSSTLGPAAGLGRSSLGLTTRPTAVSRNSTGEWAVLGSGSGSGGSGGGQRFDEFGARVPSGPSFGGSRQAASLGARPGGGQPWLSPGSQGGSRPDSRVRVVRSPEALSETKSSSPPFFNFRSSRLHEDGSESSASEASQLIRAFDSPPLDLNLGTPEMLSPRRSEWSMGFGEGSPEKSTSATGTSSEKTTPSKQSHVSRASMSSPAPAGRQSPAGPSTRQFASPTPSRPFSPTLAWNGLTPASPRQSISSTSRSPSLSSTAGEIVGEPKPFDEEAFLNDIKFGITRAIMADASGSGSRRGTPPQSAPLSARTPPPETRTPPPTTRTPPPNVARAPPLPPLATRPSPAVTRTPTPPGARPLPTPPTTRPLPSPPAASRPLPSPPAAARPPLPTPPTRAPLPTPPARAPLPPFPAMRPPHMSSPLARVSAGPSPRVSDAPSARSSTVPSVRDSNTPSARNSPVRSSTVSSARISTTPPARPASPTASEYSAVGRTRRRARPMGTSVVGGGEAESVVGGGDEESVIDGWDDGESAIGGGESVVGETVGGGKAESVVGGSRRTSVVESAKAASVVGGSRRTSVAQGSSGKAEASSTSRRDSAASNLPAGLVAVAQSDSGSEDEEQSVHTPSQAESISSKAGTTNAATRGESTETPVDEFGSVLPQVSSAINSPVSATALRRRVRGQSVASVSTSDAPSSVVSPLSPRLISAIQASGMQVDPEHGPSSIEVDAVINRMAGMNIGAIPEATELPMTIERVDSDSGITSPVVPPGAPSDAGSLFSRVVSPKPTPAKLRLGAVRMSTTSTPTKSTTAAQGTPPRAVRSRPRPDSALSAAARVPAPASVGSTKPPAPEVRPESVFSSGANLRRSADPAQMPMPRTRSVFSRGPESVTSAVSEASKEPVGLFGRLQAAVSKPVQRGSTASKVPGLLGSSNAPKQTPKQTKTGKGKTPASASDDFDGGLTSSEEEDGDEEDEDSDTKTTVADDDGLDHLTESIEGASGFQPESPVVERPTGRERANSRPREHVGPAPPSEPIDQPLSVSPQLMPSADPALLEPLEGETMPDEVLSLNPVICDACYAPMPLAKWTEHIAKSGHRRNAARYSQLLMEQSTHGQPTPINDARERWAEVTRIQPRRAHPSEYAFCDVCAVFLLRGDLEHFQGKKHHRCVRAAALNDADELESVRGSVSDEENGPSAWAFRGAAAPSGALGQQAFHRPGAAEQVTWNGA